MIPWGRTTTIGISENIEGPGEAVDVDVESPKHLPNGAIDGEIKKNRGQKKRKKSKALRPPVFPDGRPELIEFGEEGEEVVFEKIDFFGQKLHFSPKTCGIFCIQ